MRESQIGLSRDRMKSRHEHWLNNTAVHPAVQEFMVAISDPYGEYFKASYYSFPKGQRVFHALAEEISQRYNIEPDMLYQAELRQRAAYLSSRKRAA